MSPVDDPCPTAIDPGKSLRFEGGNVFSGDQLLGPVVSTTDDSITFTHASENKYLNGQEQTIVFLPDRKGIVVFDMNGLYLATKGLAFAVATQTAAEMNARRPHIRHWVEEVFVSDISFQDCYTKLMYWLREHPSAWVPTEGIPSILRRDFDDFMVGQTRSTVDGAEVVTAYDVRRWCEKVLFGSGVGYYISWPGGESCFSVPEKGFEAYSPTSSN